MPAGAVRVFGADEQGAVSIDVLRWVRLAQLVLDEERVPPDAELSVLFVGEDTITDLNERFLDGFGPTDVLAFPIDDEPLPGGRHPDEGGRGPGTPADDDEPPLVLGDVLVCPAVAQRQAQEGGRSLDDELALLVVHGVLHLLDYDHAELDDAARMRRREHELLEQFRMLESAEPGASA
ncbi:MAG TPA: rRNA maturation RNase YbeY [Acidimicrobiia bacterium]